MRIKNVGIKVQKGFTLIELMITVAIVGILAAVALPAYQDYTIRAQVAEGFPLADGVKTAITEYYAQNGSFPASNATVGLSAVTGKYVGTITSAGTATSDVVTVTMGAAAPTNKTVQGQTLTMTGADGGNGIIVWTCAKGTLAQKYLPSSCN